MLVSVRRFVLLASALVSVILIGCWALTILSFPSQAAPAPLTASRTATPRMLVYKVGKTGGVGVYIRKTPRLVDHIRAWADGSAMEQVGPDTQGDGVLWRYVKDPDGNLGYVPAAYLVELGEVPGR